MEAKTSERLVPTHGKTAPNSRGRILQASAPEMTPAPLVTIVVVTRNRPDLFQRAVESVLDQSWRPLEIVIVDNQSEAPVDAPPASPGVTFKILRTSFFMNASQSRNFGLERAAGAYVGFLDDDDYYLPGKIEGQVRALEEDPTAQFAIIDVEIHRGGEVSLASLDDTEDILSVLRYRPIHTSSLLVRGDVLRKERFNEKLSKYTDLHLTYRLFAKYKAVKASGRGAVWNCDDRDDQLTNYRMITKFRDAEKNRRNWKIICDDFAYLIDPAPTLRAAYYLKQAAFEFMNGRALGALHYGLAGVGLRSNSRPAK